MKYQKKGVLISILFALALFIHLFSANPARVEQYYSTGIYPSVAIFLRYLFGWLPVSFGDILYGVVVIWLIVKIVKITTIIIKGRVITGGWLRWGRRLLVVLFIIYIIFNGLWGINYSRQGIASQLNLSIEKYSVTDLKTLNSLLLQKVNAGSIVLSQKPAKKMTSREIFAHCVEAYETVHRQYPFLEYEPASVKISLWGWLGNYVGFLGYYNPFTGEGQVNTTVPKFLQPYTTCHEIAHQIGYAKENEANFVGYLAAAASKDESLHYSVYLDLFLYANRNLYQTDSASAKIFLKALLPAIKEDLKEWRRFNTRHRNPVEPIIRWMYGKYLENNQQPSGVLSYDEVTGMLIAYNKKYGKL